MRLQYFELALQKNIISFHTNAEKYHFPYTIEITPFPATAQKTLLFQMEPETKLFPAIFVEATSKEILQIELGRSATSLPLSAAVLPTSDKHVIPQFPPRLKIQCLKPHQWARVRTIQYFCKQYQTNQHWCSQMALTPSVSAVSVKTNTNISNKRSEYYVRLTGRSAAQQSFGPAVTLVYTGKDFFFEVSIFSRLS